MVLDPVAFVRKAHNSEALVKNIKTFGNTEKYEQTIGAISKIGFGELKIVEKEMPLNKSRTGKKLNSIEFIVVHDSGNNNKGATAALHFRYLENDPGVSWHYTVDEEGVYHNMPDDEVGFHAGDGLRDMKLIDTKVKATTPKPEVTIVGEYYAVNGQVTEIKAPIAEDRTPVTKDITDAGIFSIIGDNGNYYLNATYYNKGYKLIANQGGGTRGIGIESCVNEGASLYSTWQNLAKLVAKLLVKNNLGLDRVMQHNNFSGKNCPQTLRMAGLWPMFMEMVTCEYELLTTYKDYKFTLVADNNVNEFGRIINDQVKVVNYKVIITNKQGYQEEVSLQTKIS